MTTQDIESLFSENAKRLWTNYLTENDLVSFRKYCKNIKKACKRNNGDLKDAQFMIEDDFNHVGLEF